MKEYVHALLLLQHQPLMSAEYVALANANDGSAQQQGFSLQLRCLCHVNKSSFGFCYDVCYIAGQG
jgi:hypothetical protein